MKTKHLILLEAGAIVAGLVAWIAYNTRGIMPEIAGKILLAALILAGLAALWIASTLIRRIYANVHDMLMRRQDRREREYDLRTREIELQERKQNLLNLETDRQLRVAQHLLTEHLATTRIAPDAHGYLPLLTSDTRLVAPSRLDMLALHQYGPRASYALPEQAMSLAPGNAIPPLSPKVQVSEMRPFRALLLDGTIQGILRQGQMMIGYNLDGSLRVGSWFDLYSCGIGGVSGSGKTTTVRFLLFQAALAASHLVMVDPHIGDEEESLAAQFRAFPGIHQIAPCNGDTTPVLKRVAWLARELDRRKRTGVKGPGLIFVIDEFNEMMRNKAIKDELSELLLNIEQGGRKFGIFAMLIGQRWSAQDLGGADIRTSLASTLAHRFTDEEQAKKLVGSRNGPRCLELETGHYLFRDTNGKLDEIITPDTVVTDGEIIQSFLSNGRESSRETRAENTSKVVESRAENSSGKVLYLASREPAFKQESSSETDAESTKIHDLASQIVAMQADGKQKPEIMRELWGVTPGASKEYQAAQDEYKQVMRFIAQQLSAGA